MSNSGLGTALIVDDEKTNRLILKSLLGKQGYQTIEAVNGQEAIDLIQSGKPQHHIHGCNDAGNRWL